MQWFLKYRKALREKIVTERFLKYRKVLLAVILSIAAIIVLYFAYLDWELFSDNHDALRTVGLIVVAMIGIALACWRNITAGKQAEIAMENHLTDAYTRAIDQLEKGKPEFIQQSGLYALEKIAYSNESYYRQIIEVLCAFIRLTAGPADKESPVLSKEPVKSTVQTALTILGRRNLSFDKLPQNSDVRIDLAGIKLCNANLSGANLIEADLSEADLSWAYLYKANLSGANLTGVNLREADFYKADLEGANLREANLIEADPEEAILIGEKITLEQLQKARVYTNTKLPYHIDPKSLVFENPLT